MSDPEHPFPATDPTTGGVDEPMDQQEASDLVEKVTHGVDTDDMFVQGGE